MTIAKTNDTFSYEPFTQHAFYTAINRALVRQALEQIESLSTQAPLRVVDLACGTGAITQLIVQALSQLNRPAQIIAVDRSTKALQRAAERLAGAPVTFLHGDFAGLDRLIEHADLIFFCNAIHLVAEKAELLQQIARRLSPGGVLACNTTFFDGAYVAGTERCYRLSIRRALEFLRREYPGVRPARQEHATAMQWLTAADYRHVFEASGFNQLCCSMQQGDLSLQAWQDIGSYAGFIEGALPGIPLQLGALALRVAAERVFSELGLAAIPRNWLQITAVAR